MLGVGVINVSVGVCFRVNFGLELIIISVIRDRVIRVSFSVGVPGLNVIHHRVSSLTAGLV